MKERSPWGNQATNVSNNRQKAESTVILNVGAESTVAESPQNENVRVPRSPARITVERECPTMCWEKWISLKSDHDVLENKV